MKIEDELKGRFRNDRNKALINLFFTEKQLTYSMLQLFKKHELTEPQYNILRVLRGYRSQGPSSIGFLKERMLDRNSDVSRLIDKLFEKGLVDRKENGADRRQKDVVITEKGLELLARMDDCEKKADTLLQGLTDDEISELNRLLDKIRSPS
ncbi:MAG: MarR family transcriptional regulator [Paludibacter sp.]|nr:MarR family transcriptional regulator [Paludibacter sp.]